MSEEKKDIATLAGGCFWCLEAVYEQLHGVEKIESGYAGGHVADPSYDLVISGDSGHAESVQVTYDPRVVSYREILEVFFAIHDPTTLNRQGPDVGTQYRSVIFHHDSGQREAAEAMIKELEAARLWKHSIVTEVTPFTEFYPAEEYHQQYYRRNPQLGYCQVIISPKLAKFRKQFSEKLKTGVTPGRS